jgi:hypothetical protein
VEHPIPIALQQVNMAAQPEGGLQVRQARVKGVLNREAEPRPARRIAVPGIEADRIAAAPARAAWIEAGQALEVTAPAAAVSLPLLAAETAAHLAEPRVVAAAVPLEPAAAEDLPAMEEVPAAVVVAVPAVAVAAADGGK